MCIDLSHYRKNYSNNCLLENKIPKNPMKLFHHWFQLEKNLCGKDEEINVMSISTVGKDGGPEGRIVLLKEYSDNGFIFYTNYFSSKGRSIYLFPKVFLLFYWKNTERQVLVKGLARKIHKEKSDKYFYKRPKENQIGCWASLQSTIISSREYLLKQYNKWSFFFKKNKKMIERPFYWGGYIVKPYQIEFWQGQPYRLHDRIVYFLEEKWIIKRLSP
ncbi:pyridoxamine 5'-phosphate oxidase [Blattabacterium cuenoti]|uniref:pyridoxamine 5'-phosphate oxidase n=1 Tax=Blattabacterium cuenoti TaxID=1653831 RepID=UPI00163C1957|nr:pyridoxamine 5'-phosphate oxidase [Blattabacterium cuenoti]